MGWTKKNINNGSWQVLKKIFINGIINIGDSIDVNVSGANYTIEGDDIDFISEENFNSSKKLYITYNGVDQERGEDVIYINNTSFSSIYELQPGDNIIILN